MTLGNCLLLPDPECHLPCCEGHSSAVPLGLPRLLHLTVVSFALQNTPTLCSGFLVHPKVAVLAFHCLPVCSRHSHSVSTGAHKGCVSGHHTMSTFFGLVFKASQSLAPTLWHKACWPPDPEYWRKRTEARSRAGKEMEADLGQGCIRAWVRTQVLGALGIGVMGSVSGIQSQVQAQLQKQ